MKFSGQTVAVTGAAGFIGSHLVDRLVREGCHVRALVRYSSHGREGHLRRLSPEVRGEVEVLLGDLRDAEAVHHLVHGSSAMFHLGALIAIPYSYVNPQEFFEINVLGTVNVLNAAREYGVERVVQTSTSEVYGTAQFVPISEDHPLHAQSPYAASKIGADMAALSFHLSFGLPVALIRPFNTYGPRQSARAVTSAIISQALTKPEIRLGSTQTTRDLTFVEDTVDGFVRCAERDGAIGEVINLGSGAEISIGDLAARILRQIGRDIPIIHDERRVRPAASEVERLLADASRARALLGWEPRVTLDQGLSRTIRWVSDNLDLFEPGRYAI